MTVLVIACPHALGLAIPLVIAISTSLGARNGLLAKDRLALEKARDLDVVIFDKTGTLTRGKADGAFDRIKSGSRIYAAPILTGACDESYACPGSRQLNWPSRSRQIVSSPIAINSPSSPFRGCTGKRPRRICQTHSGCLRQISERRRLNG